MACRLANAANNISREDISLYESTDAVPPNGFSHRCDLITISLAKVWEGDFNPALVPLMNSVSEEIYLIYRSPRSPTAGDFVSAP